MHFKCGFELSRESLLNLVRRPSGKSASPIRNQTRFQGDRLSVLCPMQHGRDLWQVIRSLILRGSAMSVTKDKPSEAFKNFDKSSSSESGGAAVPRRKARQPLPRCRWSSLRILPMLSFLTTRLSTNCEAMHRLPCSM